jgi:PadR family transcriptional regulator PadR
MNSQFKKGVIEMCVLKLVESKDMYGFEVIETISQEIDVNENTIYPILRRLTKQGYFDTYKEVMSVGAPRKYYKITELGKEHLMMYENEWGKFIQSVSRILGGLDDER